MTTSKGNCVSSVCVHACVHLYNNACAQCISVWDGKEDEVKWKGRRNEKGGRRNTAAAGRWQRRTTVQHREQDTRTRAHAKGSVASSLFSQRFSSEERQQLILIVPLHNTAADALFQEAIECCGVSVIVFLEPVNPPTRVQCGYLQCIKKSTFLSSCCYNIILFLLCEAPNLALTF